MGPALRKGKNNIRIEFEPADPKAPYRTLLRWSSVVDQVSRGMTASGATEVSNPSDAGMENKTTTGKVTLEREFVDDFATDLPWHHYPAGTTISDEDRQCLAALVKERTDVFKPNFAGAYQIPAANPVPFSGPRNGGGG